MPRAALGFLLAALWAGGVAAAPPVSPHRQAELKHLLIHDCGSCHGLTLRGGLGPSLVPEALRGKDDEDITAVVLDGVPGTPMPPWRSELTPDEAAWLVALMKAGVRP